MSRQTLLRAVVAILIGALLGIAASAIALSDGHHTVHISHFQGYKP